MSGVVQVSAAGGGPGNIHIQLLDQSARKCLEWYRYLLLEEALKTQYTTVSSVSKEMSGVVQVSAAGGGPGNITYNC